MHRATPNGGACIAPGRPRRGPGRRAAARAAVIITPVSDRENVPLAPLTTLGLGGPARRLVEARSEEEAVETVRRADADGEPLLVLAGGSNVVIADAGYPGTVVRLLFGGVRARRDADRVELRLAAGEPWDGVAAGAVDEGLAGIECLSGIPGSAGATPIQNVGAYGQEIAETVTAVRALDRATGEVAELAPADCGFGYRSSAFKHHARHLVLSVTLGLERTGAGRPIRYPELARALGVALGDTAPLADVRAAVLELRRGKGMVLDPADPDTASAGSFFTNPVLDEPAYAALQRRAAEFLGPGQTPPRFAAGDGRVKTSAAWLIEHAGFGRGHGNGAIGLSSKHPLAIVNRGGGTTAELVELARTLRDGVRERFGVELVPEPMLVGVEL